jgi:hypothetical protein
MCSPPQQAQATREAQLIAKANIEGCFIVSRSDMGVLFWPKKHPRRMPLVRSTHAHQ